jgi:hypothetical protein
MDRFLPVRAAAVVLLALLLLLPPLPRALLLRLRHAPLWPPSRRRLACLRLSPSPPLRPRMTNFWQVWKGLNKRDFESPSQ